MRCLWELLVKTVYPYFRHRHTDYGVKDPKPSRKPRVDDIRYNDSQIDKKKLLEIARRNAIQMMKSGSLPAALTLGPHAQEKVLAAIRSGGKTVEELTDFCKTLSQKEELGELSSASGEEDEEDNVERVFHHPFQISARPTSIVMNIKVPALKFASPLRLDCAAYFRIPFHCRQKLLKKGTPSCDCSSR